MKKLIQRAVSALTATAIAAAIAFIPKPAGVADIASAQSPKTVTGVRLNELERPGASVDYWSGDLVYFGSYKGYPLRFRVMEKYGGESYGISENVLTLDCDNIVDQKSMLNGNENFDDIDIRKIYNNSPVKKWLNTTFYKTAFTDEERALIAKSTRGAANGGPREGRRVCSMRFTNTYFFPMTGAHLDTKYGIPKFDRHDLKGLAKTYLGKTAEDEYGSKISYWLCCTYRDEIATPLVLRKPKNDYYPDIIRVDEVTQNDISVFDVSATIGVSPMMNIRSDSILFTSKVDIPDEEHKDTYKLTLQLDDMVLTPKSTPTRSANTVTVDYTKQQGADRMDRVSVVITDKGFYEEGAKVLYYGEVVNNKFTLSDEVGRTDPSNYHAYIVGEELHGECECDYASAPQEISIPAPKTADTVSLSVVAPEANVAYGTPVCTSDNAYISSYCWRNVYNNNMQVTGNARYNTMYSLTVTLMPVSGIQFTQNTAVTGVPVDTVTINKDNSLTVVAKFPVTRMQKITSLKALEDKEFPHGSTADDVKNGLPKYVVAVTEENGLVTFDITWDYSTVNVDPANADSAQEFYVYGTFDPKNYDTTAVQDAATGTNKVQIKVTVCPHTPRDVWQYNETEHYKICNSAGCGQKMTPEPHAFTTVYDKQQYLEKGGSIFDYPIKWCMTCGYRTSDKAERMAAVTTVGSLEPKVFTDFKMAWFYAKENPGSTITLLSNVNAGNLNGTLSIEPNQEITLDLSKYSLTMPSGTSGCDLFSIDGGSLTVKSSDVNGHGSLFCKGGTLFTVNSGSLTIESGTYNDISQNLSNIKVVGYDAKVTINGGYFVNGIYAENGSITISSGKFDGTATIGGNATAELSGGEYAKIKIQSGHYINDLLNSNYEYEYNPDEQDIEYQAKVGIKNAKVLLKSEHKHTPQLVEQEDETCTTNGAKSHYTCSCGKIFSDSTMSQVVTLAEFAIPAAHVGGTATCKDRAVCTRCGKEYGELSDDHSFGADYGSDENEHWLCCTECGAANSVTEAHTMTASTDCTQPDTCEVCGYASQEMQTEHAWGAWTADPADPENHTRACANSGCTASERELHSGGAANCKQGAVCGSCGAEYGDKDPAVHASADVKWDTTQTTHILVHACCGAAADKIFTHDWNSAFDCRECGYVCAHSYGEPDYIWSADGSECTASMECEFCTDTRTEEAQVTIKVTQAQSCTTPELSTCTATFTGADFTAQVKENVQTKPALGHDYAAAWTSDSAEHWHKCARCGEKTDVSAHSGGTANCLSPAPCEVCGQEYGSTDPDNHSGSLRYVKLSDKAHRQEYSCCGEVIAQEQHSFDENRVCTKCGYGCTHSFGSAAYTWSADLSSCTAARDCGRCGYTDKETVKASVKVTQPQTCVDPELSALTAEFTGAGLSAQVKENVQTKPALGHDYAAAWTGDSAEHWHKCARCEAKTDVSAHSGGTAECDKKALCEVCGQEYGSTDPDNHSGELKYVRISDKAHRQEYSCCGRVTIAEEEHEFGTGNKCEKCGYSKSSGGNSGGKPNHNRQDGSKPDDTKPDSTKPDGDKSDDNKTDGTKPDGDKPDGTKPDDTKPDDTKPDGTKPDDTKPDDTKPDGSKPEDTKPDDIKPDDIKPDDTKPDGSKPDSADPTETAENTADSETAEPSESLSDASESTESPDTAPADGGQGSGSGADNADGEQGNGSGDGASDGDSSNESVPATGIALNLAAVIAAGAAVTVLARKRK